MSREDCRPQSASGADMLAPGLLSLVRSTAYRTGGKALWRGLEPGGIEGSRGTS